MKAANSAEGLRNATGTPRPRMTDGGARERATGGHALKASATRRSPLFLLARGDGVRGRDSGRAPGAERARPTST
jgi:hypothetical protein